MNKNLSKVILASLLGGSLVGNALYANTAMAADANDKALIIDGTETTDQIAGDATVTGNANNNTLIITSKGEITNSKSAYGGKAADGDVNSNSVFIHSGGTVSGTVYGGYTDIGNANYNSVTITGGETISHVSGDVYGGFSYSNGNANYNSVNINDATIDGSVDGADAVTGNAEHNTVTISNSTIGNNVISGFASNGNTHYNTVTINNSQIDGFVYGGWVENSGENSYNSVTINGGSVGIVKGGFTVDGNTSYNTVAINNSQIGGSVYGGSTESTGDVKYNTVIINGGSIKYDVSGGYAENSGDANNNIVSITGSEVDRNVYGGYTYNGNANGNIVSITGGTIKKDVHGGQARNGDASGNTVAINNSELLSTVIAGYVASDGNANSNKLSITGGSVTGDVYGGWVASNLGDANYNTVVLTDVTVHSSVFGSDSIADNANHNKVTIIGGTIDGDVYGGYNEYSGDSINNTVTIIGDVTFANTSGLYGGYDADSNGGDAFTGNTLNIASAGLSLGNVANFENYNFYLTDANINNAAAVLNLQASSNTNLDKAKINATLSGEARALNVGDTVKLLHNSNGFSTNDTTFGTTLQQGFSLIYGVELDTTSTDSVGLKVTEGGRATEASKSPSETRLATVGFLNSGIDNFTDKGIANAVAVASSDNGAVFAAAGGGQSRLHSGSYTDIKGYNFALGAAKAITNNAGKLTYGPFAEAGWGTYDSHLDCGVRGDGNTRYYGVGAFARQDNNSGTYYEGSLRYGQTNSDYSGSGLTDGLGNALTATYDSSSAYYGAHIGIGKVSKLTDTTSADVYAKLLYTHQQGDSAVMAGSGETYDFDAVDSTRARVGARLSKDYSTRATAYVGTAYEYEFDGEATATVKGFSTLAPSIKGGSGMLELGYSLKPKAANDPTIDLSLQGWLGKKEGFTTNVNFMWKF